MTGIALGLGFLGGAAVGWWAVAVVGVLLGARGLATGGRALLVPGCAVLLATAAGGWRHEPPPSADGLPWADRADVVTGLVASYPQDTGKSLRLTLEVDAASGGGETWAATGRLDATLPRHPRVGPGDRVRLVGVVRPSEDTGRGYRDYLRGQGLDGTVFATSARVLDRGGGAAPALAAVRRRAATVLTRAVPGDPGILLAGLVTGDDRALSEPRRDAFRATGTGHLTAVSGTNLALVVTVAAAVGTAASVRRRIGWQAATALAVWAYAVLVGAEPPAVRAALVATAALLAGRVGRRADYVTLLTLAAAVMVAVEPRDLWTLSFQLSFASSLALATVLARIGGTGRAGWLRDGLVGVATAQVAVLPILLPAQGTLPLTSVPANLLAAPLVAVAFPLAAAAAVLGSVWAAGGEAVAGVAALPASLLIAVVDLLAVVEPVPIGGEVPARARVALALASVLLVAFLGPSGRAALRRGWVGAGAVPMRDAAAGAGAAVALAALALLAAT